MGNTYEAYACNEVDRGESGSISWLNEFSLVEVISLNLAREIWRGQVGYQGVIERTEDLFLSHFQV